MVNAFYSFFVSKLSLQQ